MLTQKSRYRTHQCRFKKLKWHYKIIISTVHKAANCSSQHKSEGNRTTTSCSNFNHSSSSELTFWTFASLSCCCTPICYDLNVNRTTTTHLSPLYISPADWRPSPFGRSAHTNRSFPWFVLYNCQLCLLSCQRWSSAPGFWLVCRAPALICYRFLLGVYWGRVSLVFYP